MPPKNKKQLEEEAKRLQEEQRKRQQEERRLQEQRKKYAAQKLNTGLILPVSNQLITEFVLKQSSFVNEKLRQVLAKEYGQLKEERIIKQISKQTFYHIKNLRKLFNLGEKATLEQNNQKYTKIRVCCGIFLTIFLNNHPSLQNQATKSKLQDENLLRKLVLNHSQSKEQTQKKVFDKKEVLQVLNYFKEHYFNHFLVLHKFCLFPKRQDEKSFTLYIATPVVEFNTVHTNFVDLSGNKNEPKGGQHSDRKSEQ